MKRNRNHPAKIPHLRLLPEVKAALCAMAVLFLLPLTLVNRSTQETAVPLLPAVDTSHYIRVEPQAEESTPPEQEETAPAEPPDKAADKPEQTEEKKEEKRPDTIDASFDLTVLIDGKPEQMRMDEYLWGVVAAEMPAAFDQQALCAQAVAARTYTLYRLASPGTKHPEADICGDSTCCQAWISRKDRMADWPKKEGKAYAKKITKAVESTDGLALFYEDAPILAAFHAASAGSTRSALEVWGQDYPYLREVASPEDDGLVPNYYSTVSVPREEFAQTFTKQYPKADLSAKDSAKWFGETEIDGAGLPTSVTIGGIKADTGEVRTLFGLRSSSFTIGCEGDDITFYVTGYGHGVGMSQYGANALARDGMDFKEILDRYYHGAALKKMEANR